MKQKDTKPARLSLWRELWHLSKNVPSVSMARIFTLLLCLAGLPAMATTVEVTMPGTLESTIFNVDEPSFPTLKIVGTLNSDDIQFLRSATGRMKTVETLDLSEITLMADGKVYATVSFTAGSETIDNYTYIFYLSNETYEETTVSSNMLGGRNYRIVHYGNDLSGTFAQTDYKKIIMPNHVKTAGDMTFYKCGSLTAVEFPAGLESVGMNAFRESGIKTIDLSKVKEMKVAAFKGCINLIGNADGLLDLSSLDFIPEEAFYHVSWNGLKALKSVKFSESLYHIGDKAFSSTGLTAVDFPESLKEIGSHAFESCDSITSIILPKGLERLGDDAFYWCRQLVSVEILSTMLHLNYRMFEGSPWLASLKAEDDGIIYLNTTALRYVAYNRDDIKLTFREGTTEIGDDFCYSNASEYITQITFPSTLRRIGNRAFYRYGNEKITTLEFPEGLEEIGEEAFSYCSKLSSAQLPSTLKTIGKSAFAGCGNLADISLPIALERIGDGTFSYCKSLKTIVFPESLKSIGNNAFENCTYLSGDITIPEGVEELGTGIFYNTGVWRITYLAKNAVSNVKQPIFYCDVERVVIGSNVEVIPDECFNYCRNLQQVTFEERTDDATLLLGDDCFYECPMKSITLPKGKIVIGGGAFNRCFSLETVESQGVVTEIQTRISNWNNTLYYYGAFEDCDALTKVTFPDGLLIVGRLAFKNCNNLQSAHLGNSVRYIGESAFDTNNSHGEGALTDIQFGNQLDSIGTYAFCNQRLETIDLGKQIQSIGECAFRGCSYLVSIDIPSSTKKIGRGAFHNCISLSSVTLAEGLEEIGDNVFYDCSSIKELVIPSTVKKIGNKILDGWYPSEFDIEVIESHIQNPEELEYTDDVVSVSLYNKITLRVPAGTLQTYRNTYPWSQFQKIEEMKGEVSEYTLTYIVDGEVYKTLQVENGTAIVPEPEPTKEGYTFSGWSEIPETMPDHDVTITGSFTINTYTLTYMVDGEVYKTLYVDYGSSISLEPEPTKEGYTFSGWSEIPTTMPASDVIVTGSFTINTYTLTYMVDGEVYATYEVAYGSVITPEPEPTKEGYTFSGWSTIPETMIAYDLIVTGSFTVNTYTLTYMVDGEVYKTLQVEYGSIITPDPEPTKEGYTFSGWSEIPTAMPASDVIVIGSFTINTYTLTYMVDGEVYATYEVEYGSIITPEPEPVKEGYTFSGWSEIPTAMPASDVTITGTFTFIDGIDGILAEDGNYQIYAPNGRRIKALQKGVNIVRMSNGTVQKVYVK